MLKTLDDNGGPTRTLMPQAAKLAGENQILDVVPKIQCVATLSGMGIAPVDQRGSPRPRLGIRPADGQPPPIELFCDAGGQAGQRSTRYVCGRPLWGQAQYANRCQFDAIGKALQDAMAGDTIVVSA